MIGEQPFARRHGDGIRVGLNESSGKDGACRLPRRGRRIDGALDGGVAHLRIEVRGALDERTNRRIGLRSELRHQLRILGRQPRQRDRQVDGAFQRLIVQHVRRRRGATPADRGRDAHRDVRDTARRGDTRIGKSRVARPLARDVDARLVGGAQLQHPIGERPRLLAREERSTAAPAGLPASDSESKGALMLSARC